MSSFQCARRSATCGAMWRSGLGRASSSSATARGRRMSWHKLSTLGFLLALTLRGAPLSEDGRLIESVQAGDREAVRKLIQQGVDVKASTRDGVTPLWLAVMNRDFETVDMLLKAG